MLIVRHTLRNILLRQSTNIIFLHRFVTIMLPLSHDVRSGSSSLILLSFSSTVISNSLVSLGSPLTQLFSLDLQTLVENSLSYSTAPRPPPTIGPTQYTYNVIQIKLSSLQCISLNISIWHVSGTVLWLCICITHSYRGQLV